MTFSFLLDFSSTVTQDLHQLQLTVDLVIYIEYYYFLCMMHWITDDRHV